MRTLFYNGKIYTGRLPLQEAFLVEDGRFGRVGTTDDLRQENVDHAVDLKGRFVCCGFNDSHMHLLGFGQMLGQAALGRHTESLADMLTCLKEHLAKHPVRPGQWLRSRGWNQDYFQDVRRMPSRTDLDQISTQIPILITRCCGHSCVVNSKALELAGVSAETQAPEGGAIDFENGRFFDNAIDLIDRALPRPSKEEIKEMLRLGGQALLSYGVTSIQTDDYSTFREVPFEIINEAYREVIEDGSLPVRIYEQSNFISLEELQRFIEAGNMTGTGSEHFRIGPLKLLGDGALGSRTAHLSRPYLGTEDERGFNLFSDEQMDAMILYAHTHGMQVAVHAIGDACLDQVLNAFRKALTVLPREDHRHGIVHCQVSRKDQLETIRALGLQVYAQSVFLDYDNHIVDVLLPPELSAFSYHWKTLMDQGVRISNGSDCPVELPDVMKGLQCAVTRTSMDGTGPYHPAEAFTVQEALDTFTIKGAETSFQEDIKGTIEPGKLADFVVLDQDPFAVEPDLLHKIRVLEVFIDGERVR